MNLVRDEILAMEDSPILEVWRMGISIPDVIGLWAGEPDIPTPPFICDEAIRALRAGHTFYTHNRGIPELRAAIRRYLLRLYGQDIADDRVAVTTAGMNAVQILCQAMLGAGSKAVAITPSWPNIMRAMTIATAPTSRRSRLRRSKFRLVARSRRGLRSVRAGNEDALFGEPRQSHRLGHRARDEAEALLALDPRARHRPRFGRSLSSDRL
jgi:hypothetical protein